MFSEDNDMFTSESEKFQESDSFKEAQYDLANLSEEEFLDRYKATKLQYQTVLTAMRDLQKVNDVLSEMGALSVDSELGENTEMLIADYARLLEQMHMASYWEREG